MIRHRLGFLDDFNVYMMVPVYQKSMVLIVLCTEVERLGVTIPVRYSSGCISYIARRSGEFGWLTEEPIV